MDPIEKSLNYMNCGNCVRFQRESYEANRATYALHIVESIVHVSYRNFYVNYMNNSLVNHMSKQRIM